MHALSAFDRLVVRVRPVARVLEAIVRVAPHLRKSIWNNWYEFIEQYCDDDINFLNYGYAPLGPHEPVVDLRPGAGAEEYSLRLYRRVAGAVELRGKDVLEVGCGRGGGAAFILGHFGPRSVTGVDYVEDAVSYCNARHLLDGLSFKRGDAEDLPFPDASFDAVVNVESSHCYPAVDRFLGEVVRVLRGGGHLLLADLRPRREMDRFREQIARAGLSIVEEESITPNVLKALELTSGVRFTQIQSRAPRWIRPQLTNFAGVEGFPVFEALRAGRTEYVRFVARKSGLGGPDPDHRTNGSAHPSGM